MVPAILAAEETPIVRAGHAFAPIKEYVIRNTDKLEAYALHILCPARFGGESDGNRIHVLSSRVPKDAGGKELDYAEYWYAEFDLPAT